VCVSSLPPHHEPKRPFLFTQVSVQQPRPLSLTPRPRIYMHVYIYLYMRTYIHIHLNSSIPSPCPTHMWVQLLLEGHLAHASSAYINACIPIPLHAYIHTYKSKFLNSLPLPHPYVSPTVLEGPLTHVSSAYIHAYSLYLYLYMHTCIHTHLNSLKVPCTPKWFDFESPLIKTTKLWVDPRSGIWATRMYP